MKFKHSCSTNADEGVKHFQVSLRGHAGQRPDSYVSLKSFKGLFVRAATTRHTENNFSSCQNKRLCSQNSFFHPFGTMSTKKSNVLSSGRNRCLVQQNETQDLFCVGGEAVFQIQTAAKTRDSAIYSDEPAQLWWWQGILCLAPKSRRKKIDNRDIHILMILTLIRASLGVLTTAAIIYCPITNKRTKLQKWGSFVCLFHRLKMLFSTFKFGKAQQGNKKREGHVVLTSSVKVLNARRLTGCTRESHLKALLAANCSWYSDYKTNGLDSSNSMKLQTGNVDWKMSVRQCEGQEVKLQFWLKDPPLGGFRFWWLFSLGSTAASGWGAPSSRSVRRLPLFISFWKLLCSILADGSDTRVKLFQTRAECIIKNKVREDFLLKKEFLQMLFMQTCTCLRLEGNSGY